MTFLFIDFFLKTEVMKFLIFRAFKMLVSHHVKRAVTRSMYKPLPGQKNLKNELIKGLDMFRSMLTLKSNEKAIR